MDDLIALLKKLQLPFAYDHFAEGEAPSPPFLCYLLSNNNNFAADGRVYHKFNRVHLELYTDLKDLSLETKLETAFDRNDIFYNKSETWIDSEKLYEVLYIFEMEV